MTDRRSNNPGGNRGGGTTVRRVTLSERAAQIVRNAGAGRGLTRQTSADASEQASRIIEAWADRPNISPEAAAALPWLEEIRRQCFDPRGRAALDELILVLGVWKEKPAAP